MAHLERRDLICRTSPKLYISLEYPPLRNIISVLRSAKVDEMPDTGNILVGIKVKKAVKVDVKGPITNYIKRVYGDHMAQEAADSLETLQDLRNQIVGAATSVSGIGMDHFTKYYGALRAIEIRFPVSSDSSHVNVNFKWHDAFREKQTCTQKNIHFEKACTLFCMAAIASQKGLDVSRKTESGITEAVKSFALSAGLLKYLRENVTLKTDTPRSVDISGECCTMLESLMLAQAQEMFYELMHAKRTTNPNAFSHGTLAQVASSTAGLYAEVAEKYAKPQLVPHFDKEWAESSRVKSILYTAEAHLMQALQLQPQAGAAFGEYLGHLRKADALMKSNERQAKQAPSGLQQQYKDMEMKIAKQLESAEREQRNIYMQLVPKVLPEITPKKMAQPKDVEETLSRPEEWFADIVPDKVTRNLSKYTSQMEEVVRDLLSKLEGATDDARVCLVTHGLPTILDSITPGKRGELPEKAQAALAEEFVARGPGIQLQASLANLTGLKEETMSSLQQCSEILDQEEQADAQMRAKYGERWVRPQSNILTSALRETIGRYQANLATAGESDARVLSKLEANRGRLESLSAEGARSLVPTLQQPMVVPGAADAATVTQTLRGTLAALDALSQNRAALEDKIKSTKDSDNVLPELLQCGPDGADAVFAAHLARYDGVKAEVAENVSRQQELLGVIASNMSAFKQVYDVDGWQSEINRVADMIVGDVRLGMELLSQLNEGVVWYTGMQDSIKKLKQMCSDFVMTRNMDKQEREAQVARQDETNRANMANEEAAKRLQQMDINTTGATTVTSAPPPAAHAAHHSQPQYPAPPIGPAVPAASPYSAYPAPPTPAAAPPGAQHMYPQYGGAPPPQGQPAPPPHNPYAAAQPPPPYGPAPPHMPPYGAAQQPAYYQAQTYPQGPYGQQHGQQHHQ